MPNLNMQCKLVDAGCKLVVHSPCQNPKKISDWKIWSSTEFRISSIIPRDKTSKSCQNRSYLPSTRARNWDDAL